MAAQLISRSEISDQDKKSWDRIVRSLGDWKTVADVGASSYARRVELFETAVDLHKRAITACGHSAFPGAVTQRRVLRILLWATKQQLHSPRVSLLQSDFVSASTWANLRSGERRDGAFFAFLGLPTREFDYVVGKFSAVRAARRSGRAVEHRRRARGAPGGGRVDWDNFTFTLLLRLLPLRRLALAPGLALRAARAELEAEARVRIKCRRGRRGAAARRQAARARRRAGRGAA
jgi:hypothetical protein